MKSDLKNHSDKKDSSDQPSFSDDIKQKVLSFQSKPTFSKFFSDW